MGCKHRIHLFKCERIDHKRHIAQIGLHRAAAAHIRHLVAHLHLPVAVGSLSVSAPEIDGDVRTSRRLKPYPGTAKPPHGNVTRLNNFVFDVLHKPGTPFREG